MRSMLSGLALAAVVLYAKAAGASDALPHSLLIWDNAARTSLPLWLALWLLLVVLSFLSSLFFVRRHWAARIAIGGFALSHVLVVLIELGGVATLRTGLVSVTHVIGWAPVWIVLARELPAAKRDSRYGTWCRVLLAVISVCLIFDFRDAGMYVYYQLAGHPALA